MIGDSIKNANYQASFYQHYDFGRPQTTGSTITPYPTESASIPFEANFILSNHLQKPVLEQNKYNDIYCNTSIYGGSLYPEPGYTDEMAMHLVSPEWRQTIPQSSWDIKADSKNPIRPNTDVEEHYFRKSNLNNPSCPQSIIQSSEYHSLDNFSRNINSTKGSQYFYPTINFGSSESKNLSRINSNYSSDNSSFSSLSPKMSFEMNKSAKTLPDLTSTQNDYDKLKKTHIKKPLNAFMLFMKEMRSRVVAECTLKESAAINQILGRRWHALTREEQTKYYEMARKEKELHQQLYPNWSARDNYASHTKRKKKRTNTLFQMSYFNHGNSFKNSHQINGQKFQSDLSDPSMLDQNSLIFANKRGLLSNHNFFYKPGSPYHIDPLLALHYGSTFPEKFSFTNNQPCFSSSWAAAELTDSININKDCSSSLQNSVSNDIPSERIQNDSSIATEIIPESMTADLEMVDRNLARKPHLMTESVF